MAAPVLATQMLIAPEPAAQVDNGISIDVKGNTIIVSGAQGMDLEVISLTGRLLHKQRIE